MGEGALKGQERAVCVTDPLGFAALTANLRPLPALRATLSRKRERGNKNGRFTNRPYEITASTVAATAQAVANE